MTNILCTATETGRRCHICGTRHRLAPFAVVLAGQVLGTGPPGHLCDHEAANLIRFWPDHPGPEIEVSYDPILTLTNAPTRACFCFPRSQANGDTGAPY